MIKKEHFAQDEKQIAELARTLSHPARIAILKFLATSVSCISGDISDEIPLSRTTVSQHLQALKKAGFITGEIEGVKVNYCLNQGRLQEINKLIGDFFDYLNNCINCC